LMPTTLSGPCLLVVAHLSVLRALEIAGKRMLNGRTHGRFPHVPRHELHTVLPPVPSSRMDEVMKDTFTLLPLVCPEYQAESLIGRLDHYVRLLLLTRTLHNINDLPAVLKGESRGRARASVWD
jgi:hypothetical protein